MCGRFVQQLSTVAMAQLFGAEALASDPGERYNVAPTQAIDIVAAHEGKRILTMHRWGFVPTWAKDLSIGSRMINARGETVATSPAFRSSFRSRRCIIPADAFYEWQRVGGTKQPYAIVPQNNQPFAFAGLWSPWHDPQSEERILTCAIITTAANGTMRSIHDRMPVILAEAAFDEWLDPSFNDTDVLQTLLKPCPDDVLRAYPISRRVNNVRNDGAELLVPATTISSAL